MTGMRSSGIEAKLRPLLRWAFVLLLLAPYWIWFTHLPRWSWPALDLELFQTAFTQSLFSAFGCMLGGILLFCAYQSYSSPLARKAVELSLLFPNLIPPLFLAMSLLAWVTPFPYGLGAVVASHVLLNAGLVAISLDRLIDSRLGGQVEVAWIAGSSRLRFCWQVAWPSLRLDLALLFLFVFSLAFTSFSLPLLLGGPKQATLEVGIFEAIRNEGQWDKGVLLAIVQTMMLGLFAWILPRSQIQSSVIFRNKSFLALSWLKVVVFLPASVLFIGWVVGMRQAHFPQVSLIEPLLTSTALGLAVGTFTLVLMLWVCYLLPQARLQRFLDGYLSASSAITGFALLLVPGDSFLKLAVALTLLSFPLLFRWIVSSALRSLEEQIAVARTLGASWRRTLLEVVWPQTAPAILRASGLAALWASGDFAISGILAGGYKTLPLVMQDLLGAYQIESAQLLLIPLALVGLALYGLFVGATRYVAG